MRGQRLVVGWIFRHVENDHFFAARRYYFPHRASKVDCLLASVLVLRRIDSRTRDLAVIGRKEPLGLLATHSAASVVHPVDGYGHPFPSSLLFVTGRRLRHLEQRPTPGAGSAA